MLNTNTGVLALYNVLYYMHSQYTGKFSIVTIVLSIHMNVEFALLTGVSTAVGFVSSSFVAVHSVSMQCLDGSDTQSSSQAAYDRCKL
jgi:hypothetical protein